MSMWRLASTQSRYDGQNQSNICSVESSVLLCGGNCVTREFIQCTCIGSGYLSDPLCVSQQSSHPRPCHPWVFLSSLRPLLSLLRHTTAPTPLTGIRLNPCAIRSGVDRLAIWPIRLQTQSLPIPRTLLVRQYLHLSLSRSRSLSVNLHVHFTPAQYIPVHKHLSQMHQRIRVGPRV